MLETVASLQGAGLVVELVVVLLDREQGGERNLRDRGISVIRCVCMCVCVCACVCVCMCCTCTLCMYVCVVLCVSKGGIRMGRV